MLVGYDGDSTNYRVYDPIKKTIKVSRDLVFNEKIGKINLSVEQEE